LSSFNNALLEETEDKATLLLRKVRNLAATCSQRTMRDRRHRCTNGLMLVKVETVL
jgi:hypothetical protein